MSSTSYLLASPSPNQLYRGCAPAKTCRLFAVVEGTSLPTRSPFPGSIEARRYLNFHPVEALKTQRAHQGCPPQQAWVDQAFLPVTILRKTRDAPIPTSEGGGMWCHFDFCRMCLEFDSRYVRGERKKQNQTPRNIITQPRQGEGILKPSKTNSWKKSRLWSFHPGIPSRWFALYFDLFRRVVSFCLSIVRPLNRFDNFPFT